MERRHFIRTLAAGSLATFSLSSASLFLERRKLTILHTNDTHSQIDPFPKNHSKYPNQGGVERRKLLIDRIRAEEKNVLLLDSGDIFQGTPYFNVHGGALELKLMSEMGYDAATLGNHDFDGGLDGFAKAFPNANFPFLCANYDFSETCLNGLTQPFKIFKKSGLKIGVFGLGVELDGLVSPILFGNTHYLDPISTAQKLATYLKIEEKCHYVICLSHLGYSARLNSLCDTVLAKKTKHIDLILGGHTHTFMEHAEVHKNSADKTVLINQAGWAGLMLGRVDIYFDDTGEKDDLSQTIPNANLYLG